MAKPPIIVISTNSETLRALKRDLSAIFTLKITDSGTEALKLLRESRSSAVLMDHSLEDFHADTFIDKVRNNPVTRNTPFVILSREGSNAFVFKAVRAGISHYIGIPYEPQALVEKVLMAINPRAGGARKIYFQLPTDIKTKVTSFGRISFISPDGIHFETHLALQPNDELEFYSPLCDGIKELSVVIKVANVSSDCFYNYPFAVDAMWNDPSVAKRIITWIQTHKSLNSPKKSKILGVAFDITEQERLIRSLDASRYSLRFCDSLDEALANLPFIQPKGLVTPAKVWNETTKGNQQRLLKELKMRSIILILRGLVGDGELDSQIYECPDSPEGVALGIKEKVPPQALEPDRLYFSKTLEDSRIKIFLDGKIRILSESGVNLALNRHIAAPCNLQLDLKTFTGQNLRNPFIRAWPPMDKLSGAESEQGKFGFSYNCHFLGINDSQGQAIRQWLRAEEMKDRRDKMKDIPLVKKD